MSPALTSIHSMTTLNAVELRQQLGEVLERVHYQAVQFRILRKDKPMARLVNEQYMEAIDQLIDTDPSLADTLALMLNEEAMAIIEQGKSELNEGNLTPLHQALNQK